MVILAIMVGYKVVGVLNNTGSPCDTPQPTKILYNNVFILCVTVYIMCMFCTMPLQVMYKQTFLRLH